MDTLSLLNDIKDNTKISIVENARKKFRDGFALAGSPDPLIWDIRNDENDHIINQGGNSSSASYVRLSLSPFAIDSTVSLTSKDTDLMPFRVGYGITASQRILGQEIGLEIVGVNDNGNVINIAAVPDKVITGANITIASNVGTVTLVGHGLKGGDRILIYGCSEPRLNVGPVIVTVLTSDTFSVPITLANGSYSCAGGFIKIADPLDGAFNAAGYLFENATVTNASNYNRRNGSSFRYTNGTVATTAAIQSNTSPYTDAFISASNYELYSNLDELSFRTFASDGIAAMSSLVKRTQGVPDHEIEYKLRIRAKNLKNLTVPIAQIISIAKTASTTATVVCDHAHGLAVGDQIQIYGVRDQVNYPNLTAQTAVASIIDSTSFTVIIGTSSTTSSAGGVVWKVQGSVLAPGVFAQVVQSISRTNNVLSIVGNTTWATPLPGEYIQLHGMDGVATVYNQAYKVLRVNTSTLELESVGDDFASIDCGGVVIKRTDVRLHFVRILDYTRMVTEVVGGRGNTNDINNAVPVAIAGSAPLTVTPSTGVSTTIWNAAGWGGFLVADIASAAITTSTTVTGISPGVVANIGTYAHSFNIIVTASTGTNQTLDVGVEESMDGTNWVRIYDFPRITSTGAYTSPLIRSQFGNKYRYVQTVSGTTPSFTRAVNRLQYSSNAPLFRQFIDRSVVNTTLNATTPTYNVDGADMFQLYVNMGTITTTAPQFVLEGSEDGTSFYLISGTPLTTVASSTVTQFVTSMMPKFVRGRVSTAGVASTLGYVSIKAMGK